MGNERALFLGLCKMGYENLNSWFVTGNRGCWSENDMCRLIEQPERFMEEKGRDRVLRWSGKLRSSFCVILECCSIAMAK